MKTRTAIIPLHITACPACGSALVVSNSRIICDAACEPWQANKGEQAFKDARKAALVWLFRQTWRRINEVANV